MITCREDLHKLVVDCSDIAMLELFIGKMVEFDIRWSDGSRADSYPYHEEFDATGLMVDGKLVSPVNYCDCLISGYRPVELSDFIPCNNVKYYDKDEEIKPQDGFVSNSKEERMINGNAITYATFQNAKICNPDSDIYLLASGKYSTKKSKSYGDKIVAKCDPRYYCINGFEFANRGYSLEVGDSVLVEGRVYIELTKCGVSLVTKANQKELLILKSKQMDKSIKDNNLMSDNNSALDKAAKEVLEKTHNEIMSAMPRTKTEYIKLSNNDKDVKFWEVARDFSEIEGIAFYFLVDDSYLPIVSNQRLLAEFSNGNLYRKVEKQVTWHDNAVEFLESISECETFMNAINENKPIELEADDYKIICRLVVESVDKK